MNRFIRQELTSEKVICAPVLYMSSVRDYLSPEPLMFVTDLTRGRDAAARRAQQQQARSGARRSRGVPGAGEAPQHHQTSSPASAVTSVGVGAAAAPALQTIAALSPPPSIYDRVKAHKRKLESEQEGCAALRERIAELEAEESTCVERYKIRRKRELAEEISELRAQLEAIESGDRIQKFEEAVAPYLKAFQRQQFCRPTGASASSQGSSNTQNIPDEETAFCVSLGGGAPRQVPPAPRPGAAPLPVIPPPQSGSSSSSASSAIVRGATSVIDDFAVAFEGAVPPYDIEAKDTCKACGEPVQLHTGLSMLVCVKCGTAQQFLDATASLLSFSDDSYDYASFSYKRINHFVEWVSAMQAKETTEIPAAVLEAVMGRLADERVASAEDVTVHKVREVLKKLKLRKYYEHTQLITCKITGHPPPRMTPTQEERIKLLFMAASSAFQQLCPPDRSNFLSYNFVLFKFAELLGYDAFLPNFALLRGPAKLRRQDEIYKMLCEALDWEFIPSIAP